MLRLLLGLSSALSLSALAGCGGSDNHVVQGVVQTNGMPVSGAIVMFVSDNNRTFSAKTDAEGTFDLIDPQGVRGIPAGKYKVTIKSGTPPVVVLPEGGEIKPDSKEAASMMLKVSKNTKTAAAKGAIAGNASLPAKYANLTTTPLAVTVPLEQSPLTIDLK